MFNLWGFLESERSAARLLGTSIVVLRAQASKFEHALSLAEYCDLERGPHRAISEQPMPIGDMATLAAKQRAIVINRQFIEWKQLAASHGAVVLYNFAEVVQTIDGLIGNVPTAKEHMDKETMKAGRAAFFKAFPDYADVRFAVAHAGRPFATPKINKQQLAPGINALFIEFLRDRTLTSTVNGKEVRYSLVPASRDALMQSTELIERAFDPVREFAQRYSSAKPRSEPA